MTASVELVEVVDEQGRTVEVVSRGEIRRHNLCHRCTYVVVITSAEELVVHQRAAWKDVYPSYWDVAFGGVCGVGETWELAAKRELFEEAGISGIELVDLGLVSYEEADGSIYGRVYITQFDGRLTCPDGEVVSTELLPIKNLEPWLEERLVCSDSKQVVVPKLLSHLKSTSAHLTKQESRPRNGIGKLGYQQS